jgi:hypothetical protein
VVGIFGAVKTENTEELQAEGEGSTFGGVRGVQREVRSFERTGEGVEGIKKLAQDEK